MMSLRRDSGNRRFVGTNSPRQASIKALSLLIAGIVGLSCLAGRAEAAVFSLAGDFSTTNGNPHGVWGYGYETTLGGTFNVYPTVVSVADFPGWGNTNVEGFSTYSVPADFENQGSSTVMGGSVLLAAGQAAFHPGHDNEISIYRFIAPATADYLINASFEGADTSGATQTLVSILDNNAPVFTGPVIGDFAASMISTGDLVLPLAQGDTLDFAVGQLAGHFYNDTTAVAATISDVPEPSSLMLLAGGLFAGGLLSRRSRLFRPGAAGSTR